MERFTYIVDHLPAGTIEADTPEEASRMVSELVRANEALQRLPDDEPVQIKRADHTPWGRNLTLGDFRRGPVTTQDLPPLKGLEGPARRGDP